MLKDIRDLLEEDDDLYPSETERSRRPYYILGGVAGGVLLLAIICLGVYAIFLNPGDAIETITATSESATQLAALPVESSATAEPATRTPTNPPPSATPLPTDTPSATDTPVPTATMAPVDATPTSSEPQLPTTTPVFLFQENFEGSGGAWPTAVTENYEYGVVSGEFRVHIVSRFIEIWTVRARDYPDLRTEADFTFSSGADNGYAGVMCRFQDGFNFYGGLLNGSGDYAIVRRSGNSLLELAGPENGGLVENPEGRNRIRLDCDGTTLTLYVNGARALEIVDDTFETGRVGLFAGTLETSELEVVVDDYIIAEPEG